MGCKKCLGRRHVWDDNTKVWIRCDCFLIEERNRHLASAGIPEFHWDTTVDSIVATTPESKSAKISITKVGGLFKQGMYPDKQLLLTGNVVSVKLLGYLLIRQALSNFSARFISLDDLVTLFLAQDGRNGFNTLRDAQVMCIFFGNEYTQQIHKGLLDYLCGHRAESRFCTLWATPIPLSGVAKMYGDKMAELLRRALLVKVDQELLIDGKGKTG